LLKPARTETRRIDPENPENPINPANHATLPKNSDATMACMYTLMENL